MNGTCYTAEECSDRDGVATGSCADGFGVCCVITLTCGATSSENCTYLNLAATAAVAGTQCNYKICPASSTVSRIKLDLTMFNIAGPFNPDTTGSNAAALLTIELENAAIGQCNMDTFQVSGTGGASPVICGNNDGQHMIVDTDGAACVTAAFSFGLDTATRNYRIHAIQYDRLNEMGGPAGCLQFFTGAMGTVSTFNWATATTSTHLANQDYTVCVRRLADRCTICWSPIISGRNAPVAPATAPLAQRGSFGLSNGAIAAGIIAMGGASASCVADTTTAAMMDSGDYIIIPNGQAAAGETAGAAVIVTGANKFCGRYLSADAGILDATVCSQVTPFTLSVFTDGFEAISADTGVGEAAKNEASSSIADTPTGTMGFSLGFNQV